MKRVSPDRRPAEMESLFAIERELVPEPEEVRRRAVERARAALPRTLALPRVSHAPRPRRVRLGHAAAAAVLLTGLCALAFQAGYRMKSRSPAAPVSAPAVMPPVIVVTVPAPPSVGPSSVDPEPPLAERSPAKAKPAGPAISATEAHAMELRVLQPAQQDVARQDYASAMAAIEKHQRRFPSGRLAEEREALRVKALLGLGRTAEAQRVGARFHERFPKSALCGRMDRMLRTEK
ncbi:MAG: hypothetical protein JW940_34950 [Polyangiaceae bacterium]|nr:hypothetical protein [Polyangiaceae bacterium]